MKLSSASGAVVVGVIIVVAATVIVGFSARSGTTYPVALSGRGLPRSDAACAAHVGSPGGETRPANRAANHRMPTEPVAWSNAAMGRWKRFLANREHVTGAFTGTTAQIIRWAACKWGLDPNLLDAVAEQESGWQMHNVGDRCGPKGEASYGLFQIKNAYCNGGGAWGGYPATAQDTALNADFYAAYLRSCLDNDFDNGGSWLYGGQSVRQLAAAHGSAYVVWGCVGSWFSGNWYDGDAKDYIVSVKLHLAARDWL